MYSQTLGLRVAGTIFGIVCLLQLWRFLAGVEVMANGYPIPLWPSAVAAVITGGLCIWMWRLSMPAMHRMM